MPDGYSQYSWGPWGKGGALYTDWWLVDVISLMGSRGKNPKVLYIYIYIYIYIYVYTQLYDTKKEKK